MPAKAINMSYHLQSKKQYSSDHDKKKLHINLHTAAFYKLMR